MSFGKVDAQTSDCPARAIALARAICVHVHVALCVLQKTVLSVPFHLGNFGGCSGDWQID